MKPTRFTRVIYLALLSICAFLIPQLSRISASHAQVNAPVNAQVNAQVPSQPFIVRPTAPSGPSGTLDYYNLLDQADRLYTQGNTQAAQQLQQRVKPAFTYQRPAALAPIHDASPRHLSGAPRVYWRNAQEGLRQNLESKIFKPLQLLTQSYPHFLPGHIALAEACETDPKSCDRNTDPGQPGSGLAVLERARQIYPQEPLLLNAYLDMLEREAKQTQHPDPWIEIAVTARQFAIQAENPLEAPVAAALQRSNQAEAQYRQSLRSRLGGVNILARLTGSKRTLMDKLLAGETALGEHYLNEYLKTIPPIEDPKLQAYLTSIGQKLAQQSGRGDLNYQFIAVEGVGPRAFALPGGKIVIHGELLRLLGSEAELAGVLSQQIAHAALSHSYRNLATQVTDQNVGALFGSLGNVPLALWQPPYTAEQTTQADLSATRILASAGYAADGHYTVLTKLLQRYGEHSNPALYPVSRSQLQTLEDWISRNRYNRFAYEGVAEYQRQTQTLRNTQPAVSQTIQGHSVTIPAAPLSVAPTPDPGIRSDLNALTPDQTPDQTPAPSPQSDSIGFIPPVRDPKPNLIASLPDLTPAQIAQLPDDQWVPPPVPVKAGASVPQPGLPANLPDAPYRGSPLPVAPAPGSTPGGTPGGTPGSATGSTPEMATTPGLATSPRLTADAFPRPAILRNLAEPIAPFSNSSGNPSGDFRGDPSTERGSAPLSTRATSGSISLPPIEIQPQWGGFLSSSLTLAQPANSLAPTPAAPSSGIVAAAPPPTAGLQLISLGLTQQQNQVSLSLDQARVSGDGRYSLDFTIHNQSEEEFGFVPLFAEVLDAQGKPVVARLSLNQGDPLIPAGTSRQGELTLMGQRWQTNGSQNLMLVLKEGTTGARVFRMQF